MILTPKRKLATTKDNEYWYDHTKEDTISEIAFGGSATSTIGDFTHRLKIPVGTDKYGGVVSDTTKEQALYNADIIISGTPPRIRAGQRVGIPNRVVSKLAFILHKYGSPEGNVTFEIRKVSDDSLITSKIWGTADGLQAAGSEQWEEVEFDTPVLINEDVRLVVYYPADISNLRVELHYQDTDVLPNECLTFKPAGAWTEATGYDAAYRYTYTENFAGYVWMESSNFHGFDENSVERTYVHTNDVDDTPVNAATTAPISSNWAYDHNAIFEDHNARHESGGADAITKITLTQADPITLTGSALVKIALRPELDSNEIRVNSLPEEVNVGIYKGYSLPIWSDPVNLHEELYFRQNVPRRWTGSNDPVLTVIVALDTANTDKNFNLQLEWEHFAANGIVPITSNIVPTGNIATGTASQYQTFTCTFTIDYDIDSEGNEIKAGEILTTRLRRIVASADEITGNVIILDWYVDYIRNKIGSAV